MSTKIDLDKNKPLKKYQQKKLLYYLLAFFIPFFIISVAYIFQRVYPIGDRHILTIDLYHQYAPFLRELRSKLLHGDSLFYTWTGGLGFNFFAVITYYLASPFNLLLLLFKESQLSDAVLLITILKIGASGLAFYLYASKSQGLHSYFLVAVSTSYALSAYSLAYSWNIMWLDTIILLPITALGLERLVLQRKYLLYIISLAMVMITNYYTGFFVCIFLLLYYFVIQTRKKERALANYKQYKRFNDFLTFAGASVLAAGIAAVTLLPTVLALAKTSASGDTFPNDFLFFEPFLDFTSRFLTLSPLSIRDGMPNIYMGVITLFFIPLYFLNKKIKAGEKTAHIVIILFLLFSMNNNYLNFIWHGFHYPNQLPYRNSFLLVFLFCSMLIEVYRHWDFKAEIKWYRILSVAIIALLFLQKIDGDTYSQEMILVSAVLLFVYALILNSGQNSHINKRFISGMLLFVISIEMLINSVIAINSIAENEYYGTRDGYKAGDLPLAIEQKVQDIRSENILNRASLWPDKTVNDPMLYGYPGLTVFASTYPKAPVQFFKKIGYDNNGINSYQNTGSNIIMDSLFGLNYKMTSNERCEQISFYDELSRDEFLTLYKNPYALPLIYYVPNSAYNLMLSEDTTALANQRSFIQALGGDPGILVSNDIDISMGLGNTTEKLNMNRFKIDQESGFSGSRNISFDFTAEQDGYYTLAWNAQSIKFSSVKYLTAPASEAEQENKTFSTDEISLSRKDTSLSDLGYLEAGMTGRVTFNLNDDSGDSGSLELEVARIDQNKFSAFIDSLRPGEAAVHYQKDNAIEADLTAPQNGYALFTTTYDTSWQFKVNGEKVKAIPFDNAMLLIPVQKGDNHIEAKFIPDGFYLGLSISIAAICILIMLPKILAAIEQYKKKKQLQIEQIADDLNSKIK